jgi:RNA polymerase sigma-70 factor (ECF subfamily)
LAACARGDERALAVLYDRHGKRAHGIAFRVLQDTELAEDAVQDAFVNVWRGAASYDRARGKGSTWIVVLAHRRAVDLVRRRHRSSSLTEKLAATAVTHVAGVDADVTERLDVNAALRLLSSAEREVLELAYWGGLTQSEVERALGMPLGTVKSTTRRALAKLREALCRSSDPDAAPGSESLRVGTPW